MVQRMKQTGREREEKGFQQHFQNLVLVQNNLQRFANTIILLLL
jgi:hypothetical protein